MIEAPDRTAKAAEPGGTNVSCPKDCDPHAAIPRHRSIRDDRHSPVGGEFLHDPTKVHQTLE